MDVVSEKEDELVETANALGQIVDVESMAVADTLWYGALCLDMQLLPLAGQLI